MTDPVILIAMVCLAALVEWSPRRLVPLGAVLAVGVVLSEDQDGLVAIMALAGAFGVAIALIASAFDARRDRNRRPASPYATAQRDALRARLSSSGAFAWLSFVMAALPGPTAKLLYPLLGAMRAPLMPAIAGTVIGRTIILTLTTGLFTILARALSNDERGAAEFLITALIILCLFRLVNWIDWEHRAATGAWRLRDSGADPMSARMFMGGTVGSGFDTTAHTRAREGEVRGDGDGFDILEGDVIGEEIIDDDDQPSAGELPRGS